MSICSSGSSQQRPGAADDVILTAAVISALLPAGAVWLEPFIGAIAGIITLHLPTFCVVDPPADPGLSAADILALVALGPGPVTAGPTERFKQLVERYAWYTFCECASVTTPAPPTFPTAPSGLPDYNPPGLIPTQSAPCGSFSFDVSDPINGPGTESAHYPIPSGTTGYNVQCGPIQDGLGCGDPDSLVFLSEYDATPTRVAHRFIGGTNGPGITTFYSKTSGAVTAAVEVVHSGNCAAFSFAGKVDFYCAGAMPGVPGGSVCVPCPPDPLLTGQLSQILQMVTLLQRQLAPFAYISGTLHSGLTGDGVLDVAGIVGLLANASVPSSSTLIDGTPEVRLPIGRLNFATDDGYTDRYELVTDSQLVLPSAASLFTHVGYSLAPGVTLALTELLREP